jgi:hypothetical protein
LIVISLPEISSIIPFPYFSCVTVFPTFPIPGEVTEAVLKSLTLISLKKFSDSSKNRLFKLYVVPPHNDLV